jgi:endonuclease YncB( thermonuclease family)
MRFMVVLSIALALAAGGFAYSQAGVNDRAVTLSGNTFPCTVASITDGDTFRCAELGDDGRAIRVRLSGVAAREADGSCSPGHPCPDATADEASTALVRLAAGERLTCQANGSTYGRVAAFCQRADGVDLSCAMVASGTAVRWERYWGGHRC